MERIIHIAVFFLVMMAARLAMGGCINDLDCSGALVCVAGECRPKAGASTDGAPPPASETPPPTPETPTTPAVSAPVPPPAGSTKAEVVVTPLTAETPPVEEAAPQEPPAEAAPSIIIIDQTARSTTSPGAPSPCVRSADCAEGQICEGGTCSDTSEDRSSKGAEEPSGKEPEPVDDGWALGGGITGFISLAPINAFGALSIVNINSIVPAIPFGAASLMFVITMGPLVNGSSKSARRTGVRGVLGLRIPAWIAWSISLVNGFVMIGLGAGQVGVQGAHVAATLATANVSLILFSVESIIVHAQAQGAMRRARKPEKPVSWSPSLAPVAGATGITGGMVGLGGTF